MCRHQLLAIVCAGEPHRCICSIKSESLCDFVVCPIDNTKRCVLAVVYNGHAGLCLRTLCGLQLVPCSVVAHSLPDRSHVVHSCHEVGPCGVLCRSCGYFPRSVVAHDIRNCSTHPTIHLVDFSCCVVDVGIWDSSAFFFRWYGSVFIVSNIFQLPDVGI